MKAALSAAPAMICVLAATAVALHTIHTPCGIMSGPAPIHRACAPPGCVYCEPRPGQCHPTLVRADHDHFSWRDLPNGSRTYRQRYFVNLDLEV